MASFFAPRRGEAEDSENNETSLTSEYPHPQEDAAGSVRENGGRWSKEEEGGGRRRRKEDEEGGIKRRRRRRKEEGGGRRRKEEEDAITAPLGYFPPRVTFRLAARLSAPASLSPT